MKAQISSTVAVFSLALVPLASTAVGQQGGSEIERTASGHPDLSGTYDVGTLTPMQRPAEMADKLALTDEEAAAFAATATAALDRRNNIVAAVNTERSDPNRGAPPVGGDGSTGASGNVGGYNTFWIDPGAGAFQIDGQWRTSIIIAPPNGRYPPRTEERIAAQRAAAAARSGAARRGNDGTAYWLEDGLDAPGPFDNMEQRGAGERCLIGFGSTAGPPMLSVLYNNHKRIVQGEDTVVIQVEMNHDARIIRMNAEHDPPEIRKWLGDSIGHWDGDTLVVETTNFTDRPSFGQGTQNMTVTERFRMESADTLIYTFTVEDPTVWTAPFTGEYAWPRSDNKVFEYACHEANYALEGIMKGARLLEAVFRGEEPAGSVPNPIR
jgi:hypothetical protein